jgi:hypothetical protein
MSYIYISTHKYIETDNYLQKIGQDWIVHLEQLQQLKNYVKDPNFQRAVQKVKQENKLKLAQVLQKDYGVKVNPASMFDIQVSKTMIHLTYFGKELQNRNYSISIINASSSVMQFSFQVCSPTTMKLL